MTEDVSELVDLVRATLASTLGPRDDAAHISVTEVADALSAAQVVVADEQWSDLCLRVHDHLVGAGPLGPLLRDPHITDVMVNSPKHVWIDTGEGVQRTSVTFADEASVRECARRLAARAGRPLDDAHPWVDAVLPGGQRLHAVLPPLAVFGTVISIRCFRSSHAQLSELEAARMFDSFIGQCLRGLVTQKRNILVTGGTGSGKTTLVRALIHACEPSQRIVVVEDTAELRPTHPHAVSLQARTSGAVTEVGLAPLVRQALRMRPDRLVIGEVRGEEVLDLLTALNTGHEGAFATLHANAPSQVWQRVQLLAARTHITPTAVRQAVAGGIDVVIHVGRFPQRHITEIAVMLDRDSSPWLGVAWSAAGGMDSAAVARLHELADLPRVEPNIPMVQRLAPASALLPLCEPTVEPLAQHATP